MKNKGEYYFENVDNDYGIFHTDNVGRFESGHCFELYSSEVEARERVKVLNNEN